VPWAQAVSGIGRPEKFAEFSGPELCALNACQVRDLLAQGEISASDLVGASLSRIAAVGKDINAIVTVCGARTCLTAARTDGSGNDDAGWLGGFPLEIKDLKPVAGVRR